MTADEYIRQAEWALRDLPWSQRRELVADLRNHLAELPAETDLLTRLGKPEQYAADLRDAAGLARRSGFRAYLRARRPRNVILVTVFLVTLVTAIGLAIGADVYVDRYQPLRAGGMQSMPFQAHALPGLCCIEEVDFHRGQPFMLGLDIVNTGRFPVRVLGVPAESPYWVPIVPWTAHLLMADVHLSGRMTGPFSRFHPFDLQPGQRRYLMLKGVFSCRTQWMKYNDGLLFTDIPVRYSFLWRTATIAIPLDEELAVHFVENCPSVSVG